MNKLIFSKNADQHLYALSQDPHKLKIYKAVTKALQLMESNLRHPSLNTHEYHNVSGPRGEKVFEAYAQQKTSGAYRIFWYYGPGKSVVTVFAIIPHP